MIVTSLPGLMISALLRGKVYASTGTCSTAARYRIFGSMKMTGSLLSRMAESSRPLACEGERGMTTRSPGICVNTASGDCE